MSDDGSDAHSATARSLQLVLHELQRDLDFTVDELAETLQVHLHTLQRWYASDAAECNPDMHERLEELLALCERLRVSFASPEEGRIWLRTPNRYLGGTVPHSHIRAGLISMVEKAIAVMLDGDTARRLGYEHPYRV